MSLGRIDAGWIGEAGPGPSYLDAGSGGPDSDFTNRNTTFVTWNLLRLGRMLKQVAGCLRVATSDPSGMPGVVSTSRTRSTGSAPSQRPRRSAGMLSARRTASSAATTSKGASRTSAGQSWTVFDAHSTQRATMT